MRCSLLGLLFSLVFLVVGCDSWPPYKNEATENFADNQESFHALEAKLLASEYSSVYTATGTDAIGLIDGDGGPMRQLIDNDPEWAELFETTKLSRILRDEHEVVFVPYGPHSQDGRDTEISYTHFVGEAAKIKECESEFEDLECGVCGVPLAADWWIDYMWYPMPILESEYQMYLDGTLPEDEYFEMQNAEYAECQIKGLEAIGYSIE